jgi:hypothetical protein
MSSGVTQRRRFIHSGPRGRVFDSKGQARAHDAVRKMLDLGLRSHDKYCNIDSSPKGALGEGSIIR